MDGDEQMTGNIQVIHLIRVSIFADAHELPKDEFINHHFDITPIELIARVSESWHPDPICYDPDEDTVYDGHKRVILAWLLGIDTLEWYCNELPAFLLD
jgi:hypothetical protein